MAELAVDRGGGNHQVIGTLAAVYGWFLPVIGWEYALLVWAYAFAWFFVNDAIKMWIERTRIMGTAAHARHLARIAKPLQG